MAVDFRNLEKYCEAPPANGRLEAVVGGEPAPKGPTGPTPGPPPGPGAAGGEWVILRSKVLGDVLAICSDGLRDACEAANPGMAVYEKKETENLLKIPKTCLPLAHLVRKAFGGTIESVEERGDGV